MITITDSNLPIKVPPDVAICPYCKALLTLTEIGCQTLKDDGYWEATEITLECAHEPGIDSEDWPAWYEDHIYMPYVYMMPVTKTVLSWMAEHYRIEDEES